MHEKTDADSDKTLEEWNSGAWGLLEWSLLSGMVTITGLWIILLGIVGCWLWELASGL